MRERRQRLQGVGGSETRPNPPKTSLDVTAGLRKKKVEGNTWGGPFTIPSERQRKRARRVGEGEWLRA